MNYLLDSGLCNTHARAHTGQTWRAKEYGFGGIYNLIFLLNQQLDKTRPSPCQIPKDFKCEPRCYVKMRNQNAQTRKRKGM